MIIRRLKTLLLFLAVCFFFTIMLKYSIAAESKKSLTMLILFDGKPIPGLLLIKDSTSSRKLFIPEEGIAADPPDPAATMMLINSTEEKRAYVISDVSKTADKVYFNVVETSWKEVKIAIQNADFTPAGGKRLKVLQTFKGETIWGNEITTDKKGIALIKCVDGMNYYVETTRPDGAGAFASKSFTPTDLIDSKFTIALPAPGSDSFRFRFVLKHGEALEPLDDIKECEVGRGGFVGSVDGIFYLRPDRSEIFKEVFVAGAKCQLRLPDIIAARFDFADDTGILTVGKVGEIQDVILVPKRRFQLRVAAIGPDGTALNIQNVVYRREKSDTWLNGSASLIDLRDGKYEIRAWVPGYRLAFQTCDAGAGIVLFKMEKGPVATFDVRSPDGANVTPVVIEIYYTSNESGPRKQRLPIKANSITYDDTQSPAAVIYAPGYPPFVQKLEKASRTYAITLVKTNPTSITLGEFDPKFPQPAVVSKIIWVTVDAPRIRIASNELSSGKGQILLAPGTYRPIAMFTDILGTNPEQRNNLLVFKTVKIENLPSRLQLVPESIQHPNQILDGLN